MERIILISFQIDLPCQTEILVGKKLPTQTSFILGGDLLMGILIHGFDAITER
jgi:hypothetical protein